MSSELAQPLDAAAPAIKRACSFCGHLNRHGADEDWTVLAEDEHFVAVPSLGALVPGWLLIVPKHHAVNLATMSSNMVSHMWGFIESFRDPWEREFGSVVAFEHGPAQTGRLAGCGVDHAHLHLVPFDRVDLAETAAARLTDLEWFSVEGLPDLADASARGLDYLYVRTAAFQLGATGPEIGSQVLRRVIAEDLGRERFYNWREYPHRETVAETIARAPHV